MDNRNVLISGAGIAGPALAYWLQRYGFVPTVVEQAPKPREGGYIFGLDGIKGVEVLQRMNVWQRVQEEKYEGYCYEFVDEANEAIASLDVASMTKDLTGQTLTYIKRADLARILYEHSRDRTEYVFGDSVRRLAEDADGVIVDFESGRSRQFDLVIGADGLHSAVRTLALGAESRFKRYMGLYVAAYTIPNYPSEYSKVRFYTMPRKSITLYDLKEGGTIAVFTFRREQEIPDDQNPETQKQALREAFVGGGWETSRLLCAMEQASDFFFDEVTQIRMGAWSKGRVALVGDAGYCPTLLTGYGSQLALVGAYVLAGELKAAQGDHQAAFLAYERELRPFVEQKQKNISLLKQVVPGSALGLWLRNQVMKLMNIPSVARITAKRTYGKVVREEITLKDYDAL